MLFARRTPPSWRESFRVAAWPRRSWSRSARYIGWRIVRSSGSAHGLALGLAAGAFVATTPLLGGQIMAAVVLAWLIGGSIPAAVFGTFWANPLTYPAIWLASYGLGNAMLGLDQAPPAGDLFQRALEARLAILANGAEALAAAYALLWPVLKPIAIGSLPLGLLTAAVFYYGCLHATAGYRRTRRSIARPAIGLAEFGTAGKRLY